MSSGVSNLQVRDLLLVVVFQLGLCVLLLAEIVNATSGSDTLLGLAGQLLGGVIAVGALTLLLLRYRYLVS